MKAETKNIGTMQEKKHTCTDVSQPLVISHSQNTFCLLQNDMQVFCMALLKEAFLREAYLQLKCNSRPKCSTETCTQ